MSFILKNCTPFEVTDPWGMDWPSSWGEHCQNWGCGGWNTDGSLSLQAYFSAPQPAGKDWLLCLESRISRCYWCGTSVMHSTCCWSGEIPHMASYFKSTLPNIFKRTCHFYLNWSNFSNISFWCLGYCCDKERDTLSLCLWLSCTLWINCLMQGNDFPKSCYGGRELCFVFVWIFFSLYSYCSI